MAKRKSSKSSMKVVLLNIITLVFAGCLIGFLGLPYVKHQVSGFGSTYEETASGFSLLDFEANSGVATVVLLLLIFASILALLVLVKIFCDAGIIKSKSLSKLVGYGVVLFALASFVMTIVAMIVIPNNCNSGSLGIFGIGGGTKPAWFELILSAVMGLGATVTGVLSMKK